MKRVCPLGHHKCMDGVSTQMVIGAAEALLDKQIPERPTA
jgi:hypothetical protein